MRLNPDHINAAYSRGSCESKAGNIQKSIDDYKLALSKDEGRFQIIFSPIRCRSQLQKAPYNASLFLLDNILTKSPLHSLSSYATTRVSPSACENTIKPKQKRNLTHFSVSINPSKANSNVQSLDPDENIKSKDDIDDTSSYIPLAEDIEIQPEKSIQSQSSLIEENKAMRKKPILSCQLSKGNIKDTLSPAIKVNEKMFQFPEAPLSARGIGPKEYISTDPEISSVAKTPRVGLERFLNAAKKTDGRKTEMKIKDNPGMQNVNIIKINIGSITQSNNRYINLNESQGEDKMSTSFFKSGIINIGEGNSKILNDISSISAKIPSHGKGQYLTQAYESYNSSNYKNAIFLFSKVIDKNKEDAEAYVFRGLSHYNIGNYAAAIEDLNMALKFNPTNYEIYCYKGQVHLKAKKFDLAKECSLKAIELNRSNGEAYGIKGICEYKAGNFSLAIKDLEEASKLNYKSLPTEFCKAKIYQLQGNTDILIKTLAECEEITNSQSNYDVKHMLKLGR